jgi:hypothetical protein
MHCTHHLLFQQIAANVNKKGSGQLPFANRKWRRWDEFRRDSERFAEEAHNTQPRVLHDFLCSASGVRKAGTSGWRNSAIIRKMAIQGDQ